jgi:hypothetical protein
MHDYIKQVLVRDTNAEGIGGKNAQAGTETPGVFHRHPHGQSFLLRLTGKVAQTGAGCMYGRNGDGTLPKCRILEPGQSDFKGWDLVAHNVPLHINLGSLVKKVSSKAARSEAPEAYREPVALSLQRVNTLKGSSD